MSESGTQTSYGEGGSVETPSTPAESQPAQQPQQQDEASDAAKEQIGKTLTADQKKSNYEEVVKRLHSEP